MKISADVMRLIMFTYFYLLAFQIPLYNISLSFKKEFILFFDCITAYWHFFQISFREEWFKCFFCRYKNNIFFQLSGKRIRLFLSFHFFFLFGAYFYLSTNKMISSPSEILSSLIMHDTFSMRVYIFPSFHKNNVN